MSSDTGRHRRPAHLEELVDRVLEAVAHPRYAFRKQMWTAHNRLNKVLKTPVSVHLHAGYPVVWQELIPPSTLVSIDPLERAVELQLRQKLYRHEHIPDDDVLLPTIWITPVRPSSPGAREEHPGLFSYQAVPQGRGGEHGDVEESARLWGLPFLVRRTAAAGGAYKVDPVVRDEGDMARLRYPAHRIDAAATRRLQEQVADLVDGRLPVKIATDQVRASPSETVVSLMGIESVLYGVIDRPEFIHRMMDFVTDGTIAYHKAREAAGVVDAEETWSFRTHYEELPEGESPRRLKNAWSYISAQSLCGLSPAMYEEFLQPYHERLASALSDNRVYYHGCEDLTRKIAIIKKLPNLRRFHVSAWTNLEVAVEQLGTDFVLETNVHGPDTLAVYDAADMRRSIERIMDIAGGCVFDINITDVETTYGKPEVLTTWARIAQEVTERYS